MSQDFDAGAAKNAFVGSCLASAAMAAPMSHWRLAYRVELCTCAAVKSVAAMTIDDARRINAQGYPDASEAQRLMVAPVKECLLPMLSKYPELPRN